MRDEPMRFEIALLRARVLLRLDRADKAIDALRGCAYVPMAFDGHLTAQMLLGACYVALGQSERGESLLAEAHSKAIEAHPTVRAELTVNLGIARFQLGRYDDAGALLATVDPKADIVHARAVLYRAWVAFARGDFDSSADLFRASLRAIETCVHYDRFVEAHALQGLTALCAELIQTDDWINIERRIRSFDWSADGVSRPRFWVAMNSSMMCEITGDRTGARAWAREAEAGATEPTYRVLAQCRMAAIFRGLHEMDAHREFVARATTLYATIGTRDLATDQKQLPLFLAEELAYSGAHADAMQLMDHYRDVIAPTLSAAPGQERFVALESAVDAAVRESGGDVKGAVRLFSIAFGLFKKVAYRRRASVVALRLARLTGAKRYVEYATTALQSADSRYWVAVQLAEMNPAAGPGLTETQLAVLRLLVEGKTYKEIAALRGISWKTVNNHIQILFAKFAVNSRAELAAIAIRRGIVGVVVDLATGTATG